MDDAGYPASLAASCEPDVLQALLWLREQAVHSGIDYKSLGQGWDHPQDRLTYREADPRAWSFRSSRKRQDLSKQHLDSVASSIIDADSGDNSQAAVVAAFANEIGFDLGTALDPPCFRGVYQALKNELLLPLRSLNEAQRSMHTTFNGHPVPAAPVAKVVNAITSAVFAGNYKDWRYSNKVGKAMLAGLSEQQLEAWISTDTHQHGPLTTHEGENEELDFFWATKVGGPSHGFDVEGQCLLGLLSNSRHKVILVNDPSYPHHPIGRCHFRMLWTDSGEPMLWLEATHTCFRGGRNADRQGFQSAVIAHAVIKAEAMGVPLAMDGGGELQRLAEGTPRGKVGREKFRVVLRASNGVVEASDYLSHKHDWVQMEDEMTDVKHKTVFRPSAIATKRAKQEP